MLQGVRPLLRHASMVIGSERGRASRGVRPSCYWNPNWSADRSRSTATAEFMPGCNASALQDNTERNGGARRACLDPDGWVLPRKDKDEEPTRPV